ncbi:MAG: hypothetical protein R3300_10530 [Candidatus Promineifilaceae bacterium]|nr:hypothetical protein [Candidatus Promineifilaceae bacterium]
MNGNGIERGSIPETLDERLMRRDTRPLPEEALARFQYISRGKSPRRNYRWLLYDDGRFYLARHTSETGDWQTPFDTPLPDEPTDKLGWWQRRKVRQALEQSDFMNQAPYQEDTNVRDGAYYVVTVRRDGREHEVIYVAMTPPPVDELIQLAAEYE